MNYTRLLEDKKALLEIRGSAAFAMTTVWETSITFCLNITIINKSIPAKVLFKPYINVYIDFVITETYSDKLKVIQYM